MHANTNTHTHTHTTKLTCAHLYTATADLTALYCHHKQCNATMQQQTAPSFDQQHAVVSCRRRCRSRCCPTAGRSSTGPGSGHNADERRQCCCRRCCRCTRYGRRRQWGGSERWRSSCTASSSSTGSGQETCRRGQ